MFTLSAFADEVAKDLSEQMDVLEAEGVKFIEIRRVWGKGVLKLTDEEVARVKEEATARGFGFSAIGSPIGKIKIDGDFDAHIKDFKRAVWVAKELACPNIRLFSYFIPKEDDAAKYRDEVMRRMRAKVEIAEAELEVALPNSTAGAGGVVDKVGTVEVQIHFEPKHEVATFSLGQLQVDELAMEDDVVEFGCASCDRLLEVAVEVHCLRLGCRQKRRC